MFQMVFLVFVIFHPLFGALACSTVEIEALESFRNSLDSFGFQVESTWLPNSSCCSWFGVVCSENGYRESGTNYSVKEIKLSKMSLEGRIPESLGALRGLVKLDLSYNKLSGLIPENVTSLPRLEYIDLSLNELSGVLPGNSSFPTALHINVSYNRLTGPSWSGLGGSRLEVLDVSNNLFSGEIVAEEVCRSTELRVLNVSGNAIVGTIPDNISSCRGVQYMVMDGNMMEGRIPASVSQLSLLRVLKLSFNRFTGPIPVELGSLELLEELWVDKNSLHGTVELNVSEINWRSLRIFSARDNKVSGLSVSCGAINRLVYLDVSYNSIGGAIPVSVTTCMGLQTLALTGNFFTGEIPPELGKLKNLTTLMLSNNNLVGRIPLESLQECRSLVAMVLSKNTFSGTLHPAIEISGFRELQLLALGKTNLTGTIPAWIRNCSRLQVLDLSWNMLGGEIPEWMGDFRYLFYLDLSNNSFSVQFPSQLSRLPSLQNSSVAGSSELKKVDSILFVKHRNNMTRLQYNQVSALPPSILLSNNKVNGSIPTSLGVLKWLVCLDVSNNRLSGSIPDSLGSLSALEGLDLSQNSLTGTIPSTLVKLFSLSKLNVSFNSLEGPIPNQNQFSTFTSASYIGNPGLCGAPLQACVNPGETSGQGGTVTSYHKKNRTVMVIGVSVTVGLAMMGVSIAIWIWIISTRRAVHHRDDEEDLYPDDASEMTKRTVEIFQCRELLSLLVKQKGPLTNADLVKATNNFDQANIIGCGGFGLVFAATLSDGTKVAIKRLMGDNLQMEREFEAEIQALAMVDHPNLVTLQGYSSYGNQRLLIYSYMQNGSLDYWLHEAPEGLNWVTRLEIARGAARGIAYLHLECQPHIVHRDIKSSNILLDGDFVAHVADFGLARLLLPTATHVSTEVVGTLGYIPPEYAQSWMATPKGDVYSFGVMLLELLARRRPVDVCRTNGVYDLIAWVRELKSVGRVTEVFDASLKGQGHEEEMEQMLEVAYLCINPNPQKRPGIHVVVNWLDDIGRSSKLVT